MSAELYLCRASCDEILLPPRTIGILSRRLFRSEILYRPCSVLNRRLFIAKHLLETKPAPALPPGFYLFSAEMQILKFNSRYFAPNLSAKFYLPRCRIPIFYPKPRRLAQNSRDKIYAAFRLCAISF